MGNMGSLPGSMKHLTSGLTFLSVEPVERNIGRESGTSTHTRRGSTPSFTPNGHVPVIGRPNISESDQPRSKTLSRGKQESSWVR